MAGGAYQGRQACKLPPALCLPEHRRALAGGPGQGGGDRHYLPEDPAINRGGQVAVAGGLHQCAAASRGHVGLEERWAARGAERTQLGSNNARSNSRGSLVLWFNSMHQGRMLAAWRSAGLTEVLEEEIS